MSTYPDLAAAARSVERLSDTLARVTVLHLAQPPISSVELATEMALRSYAARMESRALWHEAAAA